TRSRASGAVSCTCWLSLRGSARCSSSGSSTSAFPRERRSEACIPRRPRRAVAEPLPVAVDPRERLFHDLEALAQRLFAHVEGRVQANGVLPVADGPHAVLQHAAAHGPRVPPVLLARIGALYPDADQEPARSHFA